MVDPSRPRGFATSLASALDRACTAGAWLAVPLALLLFAQWPLRDLVGAWSRDANDAAQWIFALYVALALRAATRARAHMAAGLARALAPKLVAQALVVAVLFAWPELVHWADDPKVEAAPVRARDAERLIEEMRHGR